MGNGMSEVWLVSMALTLALAAIIATALGARRATVEPFVAVESPMDELKASMVGRRFGDVLGGGGDVAFEDTDVFSTFFAPGAEPFLVRAPAPEGVTARSVVANPKHAASASLPDLSDRLAAAPAGLRTGLHMRDRSVDELKARVFGYSRGTDVLELAETVDGDAVYALLQRLSVATQASCSATLTATIDRLVGRVRSAETERDAANARADDAQRTSDSASSASRSANRTLAAVEQCYEWAATVVEQEAGGKGGPAAQLRTAMAERGCSRIPARPAQRP